LLPSTDEYTIVSAVITFFSPSFHLDLLERCWDAYELPDWDGEVHGGIVQSIERYSDLVYKTTRVLDGDDGMANLDHRINSAHVVWTICDIPWLGSRDSRYILQLVGELGGSSKQNVEVGSGYTSHRKPTECLFGCRYHTSERPKMP
jgi:hypothetical protein